MASAGCRPAYLAQRGAFQFASLSPRRQFCLRPNSGFTLIEVLVALLVVGITLLGLGMAQNQALKNTRQSEYRSLAIYLANDMADRIRANPTGLRDGHFNSLTGAAIHWNCERAVGCSAEQMAQHDKYRWQMLLDELLPSGEGALVIDDQLVTITVTWQQREETGNEPHSHILRVRV